MVYCYFDPQMGGDIFYPAVLLRPCFLWCLAMGSIILFGASAKFSIKVLGQKKTHDWCETGITNRATGSGRPSPRCGLLGPASVLDGSSSDFQRCFGWWHRDLRWWACCRCEWSGGVWWGYHQQWRDEPVSRCFRHIFYWIVCHCAIVCYVA